MSGAGEAAGIWAHALGYVVARRSYLFELELHHDVPAALAAHIAVAVVARDDLLHRERGEVVTRHGEGGLEGLDG